MNDLVSAGKPITINGFHQAVRVGNMVYDNFFQGGVDYDLYVRSLQAPLGVSINATPF